MFVGNVPFLLQNLSALTHIFSSFQVLQDARLVLHDDDVHGPAVRPALLRRVQVEVQWGSAILQ